MSVITNQKLHLKKLRLKGLLSRRHKETVFYILHQGTSVLIHKIKLNIEIMQCIFALSS